MQKILKSTLSMILVLAVSLMTVLAVGLTAEAKPGKGNKNRDPVGAVEALYYASGTLVVEGWIADPDNPDEVIDAEIEILDEKGATYAQHIESASLYRDDISEYSGFHGFAVSTEIELFDQYSIIVIAKNIRAGNDTVIATEVVNIDSPVEPEPEPEPEPTSEYTPHHGDLFITQNGAIIDGLEIFGMVRVEANDVTIRNSYIRGRVFDGSTGVVLNNKGNSGLFIENTIIRPDNFGPGQYGILGWNFHLRNVKISNVADGLHIIGDNVRVEDSHIYDLVHLEEDPHHGGTPSHDDGIQIQAGHNIVILNTRIEGAYNAAIQITQDRGTVSGVLIRGSFLNGGGCTVNIAEKGRGPINDIEISFNTFGRDTRHYNCAIIAPDTTLVVAYENYFEDGTEAVVRRGA